MRHLSAGVSLATALRYVSRLPGQCPNRFQPLRDEAVSILSQQDEVEWIDFPLLAPFRSIVKEARLTVAGVELEMYVQPTRNVW